MSKTQTTTPTLPGGSASSSDREMGLSHKSDSPAMSRTQRAKAYLQMEIDSKRADWISIYACFLTGFTSSHSFSVSYPFQAQQAKKAHAKATYIWCGFQTGNLAQLGLALARTFNPEPFRTYGFQRPDQQALCSLLAFLIGTSMGRFGDKIGPKKRAWLVLAACMQALLAMAAALTAHFSGESGMAIDRDAPSWVTPLGFVSLAFLSASLGIQGIIGKRVASPLNTTIVLTTTWVELFNDPFLFSLRPAASRDIRIGGVAGVFLGAFVARALDGTRAGVPGSLGVLVGLRLIQVVWWALLPAAPPKK